MKTLTVQMWAARVAAVVFMLVAGGNVVGLLTYGPKMTNDFAVMLWVCLMLGSCVGSMLLLFVSEDCERELKLAQEKDRAEKKRLQILLEEAMWERRTFAYHVFVQAGLSSDLANQLANNDVLTVEQALDVEEQYMARGTSYHPELAAMMYRACQHQHGAPGDEYGPNLGDTPSDYELFYGPVIPLSERDEPTLQDLLMAEFSNLTADQKAQVREYEDRLFEKVDLPWMN